VLVFSAYAPYSTTAIDSKELVLVAQLGNHSCTEHNVNWLKDNQNINTL
jgi:hypothetical protein